MQYQSIICQKSNLIYCVLFKFLKKKEKKKKGGKEISIGVYWVCNLTYSFFWLICWNPSNMFHFRAAVFDFQMSVKQEVFRSTPSNPVYVTSEIVKSNSPIGTALGLLAAS